MARRSGISATLPPLGLAAHRQAAGVTLDQIADLTKISKRFLLAIEGGQYEELPGGIFTISYLKQYAQATGFDAQELLDHYARSQAPAAEAKPAAAESGWRGLGRLFQQG
jgi:cytoskeletal protein RodZ